MIRHSEQSTRQYAHIWSDNLQLPNVLVYNLQLPHGHLDNYGRQDHHARHGHSGHDRADRTDKTDIET